MSINIVKQFQISSEPAMLPLSFPLCFDFARSPRHVFLRYPAEEARLSDGVIFRDRSFLYAHDSALSGACLGLPLCALTA